MTSCPEVLTKKDDRRRRHHSRSAAYEKHTKARTQEKAKSLSSNGGTTQYWGNNLPNNATAQQVTAIRNKIEKDALNKIPK
ncbi:hypothetical protein [Photorhabdus africana]|uniref:hypothetical protein n=1 Tax=Photorhabdus africana TaxID=3097554 RepID=UPI002B415D7C|nr:hypothetical protein [Photorhabdus sp. CRI-LC]